MALSGSFYQNVGSGYRLQTEWSATQSVANNTSTITVKLYWMSLGSAYYVNSSDSKPVSIQIDGEAFPANKAGLADLNGNQKKLIHSASKTVSHNSVGEKSASIVVNFDLQGIRLSGTTYNNISDSGTANLNTIPRASTITSSLNWKAPNAFPISISRSSSNFYHDIEVHVKRKSSSTWTLIKTYSNVSTYVGGGYELDEMKKVFQTLATDSSGHTRIIIKTYNGSGSGRTYVGAHDYGVDSGYDGGEVVVEYSSKITTSASWNIGDSVGVSIARNHPSYTHVIKFYANNQLIHTSPTVEYSYTWNPTTTENNNMYAQTPNSNTVASKIETITYYNGIQVDVSKNATGTATVTNSNPTFGTGYTYADTNATTIAITGNDQYIIQNKSTVRVSIPTTANATAINSASMKSYSVTLNGVTKTANYSTTTTLTFDFGAVNISSNLTLVVKAIDSRGNSTQTSKTVLIVPWSPPVVNTDAKRLNGFEDSTTVTMKGSISNLKVGTTDKNAILSMQYRYKDAVTANAVFGAWTNFTYTTTGMNYTATDVTLTLDKLKSWTFEIKTTDKLGTTTITKTVNKGQPILFIDSKLNSVGVNAFPTTSNAMVVGGDIKAFNPANNLAEAYLGWKSNVARIRVGGSGSGSTGGFQIQGTGDKVLLGLNNTDSLILESGAMKLNGSNIFDYEVPRTFPSFQNSWESYFECMYWKTKEGIVYFQGMIRGGADGTLAFTLPAECRPTSDQLFYAHTRGGGGHRIDIYTDGRVVPNTGDSAFNLWYCLTGIFFSTK